MKLFLKKILVAEVTFKDHSVSLMMTLFSV